MSLRRQLVVIFTSAIILPVLLATGVFGCVLRYQMNTIKKTYGIELSTDLLSGVSVDLVSKLTAHVEQEIRNVILQDTGKDMEILVACIENDPHAEVGAIDIEQVIHTEIEFEDE